MEIVDEKPKAKGKSKPTMVEQKLNPQDDLSILLEKEGFSLDDFILWGRESGNIEEQVGDNITCFDDVPTELATRVLRARVGLLQGLASMKGK